MTDDVVYRVSGLRRSYRNVDVLRGVDLEVAEGEVLVIMGPSGAGKTTLVRHLLGLLVPQTGEIRWRGHSMAYLSDDELEELRGDIGALLQGHAGGLQASRTVRDNLREVAGRSRAERAAAASVESWLDRLGLEAVADLLPQQLSEGQRRRAGLAQTLITGRPVLVLDDLEGGQDPVRTTLCCEVLNDERRWRDLSIIVTTHSVAVARQLADRVVVLDRGRVVASGTPDDVLPNIGKLLVRRPNIEVDEALPAEMPEKTTGENR